MIELLIIFSALFLLNDENEKTEKPNQITDDNEKIKKTVQVQDTTIEVLERKKDDEQ